ncbi:ChaN family lipoprotein [Aromatoleum sp.]|uniref:ChaN family lipoprotein n=1 Tax=Aromatoleum sp. TaxID=2307007 RepID=UPI002FC84424
MRAIDRSTACALAAAAMLIGCSLPSFGEPGPPVAGTLHVAPDGTELDRTSFRMRLAAADVIYLGEQHGNRHHHAAQLGIVADLVASGRKPAIGFEAVSLTQTSDLMNYVFAPASGDAEAAARRLRSELGWTADGDRWRDYGPLLEFARANKLRIAGIDLPGGLRRRISRVGVQGLSAVERAQLYDTGFEDAAYREFMHGRLDDAHCGFARPALLDRLYETWLARNDAMMTVVTTLAAERPGEPVVVIVGGGHVAHNMGVFERVAQRAPQLRQLNIGFRGEQAGTTVPELFAPVEFAGRRFAPTHEIIWLTPGASGRAAASPCAGLEDHMKKMGK